MCEDMCGYVWVCEEGIGNYKFASRCGEWGLYHIYQQLSELLACILLDDEVMFLVILERKVQISCIFCGFICGGCGFYDFIFDLLLFLFGLLLFCEKKGASYI